MKWLQLLFMGIGVFGLTLSSKQSQDLFQIFSQSIRECLNGNRTSCREVGTNYMYGIFTRPNFPKAVYYYQLGCKLGDRESCARLGFFYLKGIGGTPRDGAKLIEKYGLAAKLGEGFYLLGRWYLSQKKYERAYNALYYACNLLSGKGCCLLGKLIYQGIFRFGFDKWSYYLERGCENFDYECCREIIYNSDIDSETKVDTLKKLYSLCETGTGIGCTIYGEYLQSGGALQQGLEYLLKGCRFGDGRGCYLAGMGYLKKGKIEKGKKLLQKGCQFGYRKSCKVEIKQNGRN